MSAIVDLLGESVIKADGSKIGTDSFSEPGKVVGLYFSAHWCPPCRGFTPKLVEWYENFKKSVNGKNLEMVFISSDQSEDKFKEYLAEMPWYALPFADREKKNSLSKKFKVQGIPTLVFVDGHTGKLITADGRSNVMEDPEGANFPWHPKSLDEILQGTILRGAEQLDFKTATAGKVVGIYFSAHWCPPCRGFTPELAKIYNKVTAAGKNFEVVFVSSDRQLESFQEYYKTMDWLALPFADARISQLTKHFGIEGIPSLIILDENNELITKNGREAVKEDSEGANFPWYPKPFEQLKESNGNSLNEAACLIYFTDADKELTEKATATMQGVAVKYQDQYKQSKATAQEIPELFFFYEGDQTDDLADSVRSFCNLEDRNPMVSILDIPERRTYTLPAAEITPEVLQKLVDDFRESKLAFRPIHH